MSKIVLKLSVTERGSLPQVVGKSAISKRVVRLHASNMLLIYGSAEVVA